MLCAYIQTTAADNTFQIKYCAYIEQIHDDDVLKEFALLYYYYYV